MTHIKNKANERIKVYICNSKNKKGQQCALLGTWFCYNDLLESQIVCCHQHAKQYKYKKPITAEDKRR
jgi:hypothetical protein